MMRLLLIGDMDGYIGAASQIALKRGASIVYVDDVEGGMKTLRSGRSADVILIDVGMPIETLIDHLAAERFSIPVIACGIGTETELAVRAIKAGAKDYLPLPPEADLIAAVFESVCREDNTLLFRDPIMQNTLKLVDQIAPSDASLFITGESGTGKEVLSRYIHQKSKRRDRPFVSVNCAAIPDHLLESELFGHEKGAFTGAISRRIGKFEEANGGTLLLDEISEMNPSLQAKLLRAIQEREIDRVGGSKPVKVDIRILSTSNRRMEDEVKRGNFREDLFFRLNVVSILIPPLRDRPLDIDLLAAHFAVKYADVNGVQKKELNRAALDILRRHSWPGNVRELENMMHRAVLLSTGPVIDGDTLQVCGLVSSAPSTSVSGELRQSHPLVGRRISDVEKDLIIGTLGHCLGNRTEAAHILGISIRTLRNKLKHYQEECEAGTPVTPDEPVRAAL